MTAKKDTAKPKAKAKKKLLPDAEFRIYFTTSVSSERQSYDVVVKNDGKGELADKAIAQLFKDIQIKDREIYILKTKRIR